MKKTDQNAGLFKYPKPLFNLAFINSTSDDCGNKFITRLLAFGSVIITLLFTSCSDDTIETSSSSLDKNQDQMFTLAPRPSSLIEIKGTTDVSENTAFKTTQAPGDDRGRFNITFRYLVQLTPRQTEVFESAAARWERIIIKDVPSTMGPIPSAFLNVPPIEGPIDDIVIEVVIAPIDGPGKILGMAGPRYVRNSDFLTLSGVMFFDVDDLDFLDELDLFEEVIVHEMGHVLGVGTLWNVEQYGFPRNLREGPDTNPYFNGKMANVHWNAEGGMDELPIENMGGPGTQLSHWRESLLNNELMTGYLNLGDNPLSRITAGSLGDLGYGTAVKGESYDLPKGTPGVDINELTESDEGQGLNIAKMEVVLEPIGFVSTE